MLRAMMFQLFDIDADISSISLHFHFQLCLQITSIYALLFDFFASFQPLSISLPPDYSFLFDSFRHDFIFIFYAFLHDEFSSAFAATLRHRLLRYDIFFHGY
jgi:hypothetical protein